MRIFKRKIQLAVIMLSMITYCHTMAQKSFNWKMQPVAIATRWAKLVAPDNVLPDYPRPQMVRNEWQNLNGLWEYTIIPKNTEIPSVFDGSILVPFPVESALSGVKKTLLPSQLLWYKRTIVRPDIKGGKRVLIHFGAVDYQTTVYINNKEIGGHVGGYQNFTFDITDALKVGNNVLLVKVWDPTDQGPNPHGKQVLQPKNIMYTATSGIWQTVWLETVPAAHISNLVMTPSIDTGYLRLLVNTTSKSKDYIIEAIASNGSSIKGKPGTQLLLPVNNAHLWSPEDPYLYHLNVRLLYKGKIIDTIGSYFGMRKIEVKNDDKGTPRLFLNNKYTYNLGVLDQGFWPEGLYTAPTDEALMFDILAIRNMGYNTIRKHIKLEPARWYYHADQIGMLVWQDMVTCAGDSPDAHEEFEKENRENIAQLHNYPSIVTWVLFNEGWARYDQQRLTEWMKKADPSRIIDGHTGENYDRGSPQNPMDKWSSSDMTDIHDYPGPGIPPLLPGKAQVLGEWGGVRVVTPKHQWNGAEGWGYIQVTPAEFERKYEFMIKHLKVYEGEGLSGSIYTEPFDVETEENGMMSYDREVIKIPAGKLRQIHSLLVPRAESYVWNGFKALDSDTVNKEILYTDLLKQYKAGIKDSAFLYELAMLANNMKDDVVSSKVATDYIKIITNPFSNVNLRIIQMFTKRSSDPGFTFFLNNPEKVNNLLGENFAEITIRNIISREEIEPFLKNRNAELNWDKIYQTVKYKYGRIGEEKVYGAQMIYFLEKKDWEKFGKYYALYYQTAITRSEYHINNISWTVFEHVTAPNVLNIAIKATQYSLEKYAKNDPTDIDTYANLLYKSGRKLEAIKNERQAVDLSKNEKAYVETLEKMKNDIPTWK